MQVPVIQLSAYGYRFGQLVLGTISYTSAVQHEEVMKITRPMVYIYSLKKQIKNEANAK